MIGGYTESFSQGTTYICRWSHITLGEFRDGSRCSHLARSKESYKCDVERAGNDCAPVRGIKHNSIFNELKNFHVVHALPPCLGHDLFEGIVKFE